MNLPKRKHLRLKNYDYSQNGAYFITICTANRRQVLGSIPVGRGDHTPPGILLSDEGKIAERFIHGIDTAYEGVTVEKYAIMPNHIHLLLFLHPSGNGGGMRSSRPTISTIILSFKTMVTRQIGYSIWQASFYEHIVRNESDFLAIWKYIDENPLKWELDELYPH